MVWTCLEEGQWVYWAKDFEYGAAWQEEKGRPQRRFLVVGVTGC